MFEAFYEMYEPEEQEVVALVCTPSRGQRNKSTKIISSCLQIKVMLFHRCQNAKVTLEMQRPTRDILCVMPALTNRW